MLNFPVPYPNELIYSTIARAGIRHGLTSPKQLLNEVFEGNRRVIATLDLPNHLSSVLQQLPEHFSLETLAYRHTLFPLYSPFVPEDRRQRCLQWMAEQSQGAVHLAMGVAASIVKTPGHIRYCPACLLQQRQQYGEYFWERSWQAPGMTCCPLHGVLLNSNFVRPQKERHQFWPATPDTCPMFPQKSAPDKDRMIAEKVAEILILKPDRSPSFYQWTSYYRALAERFGLLRGTHQIDHAEVSHRIETYWSPSFLRSIGLTVNTDEDGWLRGIFRSHRKVFSYLQHLVVRGALYEGDWKVSDILDEVRSLPERSVVKQAIREGAPHEMILNSDQQQWLQLLVSYGPKAARQGNPALYARLYRSEYCWLMGVNQALKRPRLQQSTDRINWERRDDSHYQQLQEIVSFVTSQNTGPRRSKSFWLKQMKHQPSVEKNLHRLPRTNSFLHQLAESVDAHQIRRLQNESNQLRQTFDRPPRWRLLRDAGLSEERLTSAARIYLESLIREQDEQRNSEDQRNQG
ncbi:MAG: transcriptional antiterminator [Oceanospirillaceae bacterium]|uniref:TnsD family Tn7-like transposition protein n=1 Tax=unclassified Thalassolituus TaxID=2624967 RepID=UPI000C571703|nr:MULTISPECIES: TnsD family Tn7-like transposition protein [unclassified Thalassolituus]MAY01213.1 transcriptional antiterminator [Oceanospirillaceae bacterium]MBL33331.1 transcriptional antiterminator [Oceanospirillaceae bacterium]MBS52936.1 transcriptional antiterminator [Oceanospirillaceae bacterium]MBS55070.1 transcriptional antiterminator [Oceanospirillaceae bacterium]|tara:strand:- start:3325 stop:4878 length:1554 start_codon:yes stop_codon:yes gene_type:complete